MNRTVYDANQTKDHKIYANEIDVKILKCFDVHWYESFFYISTAINIVKSEA